MDFQIDKIDKNARAGTIKTASSTIHTPVFMPVGTVGAVKSLDAIDLETLLKPEIILANTYHYISDQVVKLLESWGDSIKFYQIFTQELLNRIVEGFSKAFLPYLDSLCTDYGG